MNTGLSRLKRLPLWLAATLYALIILAAALGAGALSREWALSALHVQGGDRLLASISQMRKVLGQYNYLPFLVAQNTDVHRLLEQPASSHQATVNRVLEQLNLVAGSTALYVLDRSGQPLAYSNWREPSAHPRSPDRDSRYFTQALAGEQGLELRLRPDDDLASLYMSAPIYTDRLAGVAVMRLDMAQLRAQLSIDHPLVVQSPGGELILGTAPVWPLPTVDTYTLSDGTALQLVGEGGRQWLLQRVVLDDLQWQVAVLTDIRPALNRSRILIGAVLISGVALALLLLYLRETRHKKRLQRQQMLERARSEEQQRDIINTAQVGLIHIDRSGRIELINPMGMQIFGVSVELVRHRPVMEFLGKGFDARPLKTALDALGTERFQPLTGLEVVGQRGDGSAFPMMISIRQMDRHPELGYLVTVIDISRRKRLEQALREANESLEQKVVERTRALEEAQAELVQAGKLAALGRMSASVVHELNQPMTAMRTYLAIAKRLLEQPEALTRNLRQQEELLDRMALITGQLKTFAYRKPERIEPVCLRQMLNQVLQMFRGRFEELKLKLDYQEPEAGLRVAGDNARYEQVMINLIKNACDAMSTQSGEHRLRIQVMAPEAGRVVLEVADNGPGIAPEHRGHLFEPFFTTKEVGQGLGLGLAIVSSILRDLGGEIEIMDTEQGACFRLTVPLFDEQETTE
ncbi:PAS domain S-box protein [Marinobacterium sp. AK62]|uniref:histidine kinase n=1 Tax=Marinobacterium alkalitolerans TaxID=1542925 RepID=A0ABS3Z8K1_9GAMM|nr:ATP-binding protein [Marinobacterium alkalitolerans]MBP0048035.1 PAS domain S-box protein [Marinobacterium alkalitolerans]